MKKSIKTVNADLSSNVVAKFEIYQREDGSLYAELVKAEITDSKRLKALTIPNYVDDNIPVEEIGFNSFKALKTNTFSLDLPVHLKRIGSQAFLHNKNLSISEKGFPNELIYIGEYAFHDLAHIPSLPRSLRVCKTNLVKHYFENTLDECDYYYITNIYSFSFNWNALDNATRQKIKDSGNYYNQDNISYLVFNKEAYALGLTNTTFNNNKVIKIADSINNVPVVAICSNAFRANDVLEEIYLGQNIKYIGVAAFRECKKLSYACLNKGLEYIGECAFLTTNVSFLYLPSSVRSVGIFGINYSYFGYFECIYEGGQRLLTTKLNQEYDSETSSIILKESPGKDETRYELRWHNNAKKEQLVKKDNCLFFIEKEKAYLLKILPSSIKSGADLIIPSSVTTNGKTYPVTTICSMTVYSDKAVDYVVIPKSIEDIEAHAIIVGESYNIKFEAPSRTRYLGRESLTIRASENTITIPKSVIYIGENVFGYNRDDYKHLENVIFEEGSNLKVIDKAFSCYPLAKVVVPASTLYILRNSFSDNIGTFSYGPGDIKTRYFESSYRDDGFPNKYAKKIGDYYYLGNKENPIALCVKCSTISSPVIKFQEGTKVVMPDALRNLGKIQGISFPHSMHYFLGEYTRPIRPTGTYNFNEEMLFAHSIEDNIPSNIKGFSRARNYSVSPSRKDNPNFYFSFSSLSIGGRIIRFSVPQSVKIIDFGDGRRIENIIIDSLPENIINFSGYDKQLFIKMKKKLTSYKGCQYFGSTQNPYYLLVNGSKNITTAFIHKDCVIVGHDAFNTSPYLEEIIFEGNKIRCVGRDIVNHPILEVRLPSSVQSVSRNNNICHFITSKPFEDLALTVTDFINHSSGFMQNGECGINFAKSTVIAATGEKQAVEEPQVEETEEEVVNFNQGDTNDINIKKAKDNYDNLIKIEPHAFNDVPFEELDAYEQYKLAVLQKEFRAKKYDNYSLIYTNEKIAGQDTLYIIGLRGFTNIDEIVLPSEIDGQEVYGINEEPLFGDFMLSTSNVNRLVFERIYKFMEFILDFYSNFHDSRICINSLGVTRNCEIAPSQVLNCAISDERGPADVGKITKRVFVPKDHQYLYVSNKGSIFSADKTTLYYLEDGDVIPSSVTTILPCSSFKPISFVPSFVKKVDCPSKTLFKRAYFNFEGEINIEYIGENIIKTADSYNIYVRDRLDLQRIEFYPVIHLGKDVKEISALSFLFPLFEPKELLYHTKGFEIEIDERNDNLIVHNNSIYSRDLKRLLVYFGNGETEVTLPEQLETIEAHAFDYAFNKITKITLGNSIKEIKQEAMLDLSFLREIVYNGNNIIDVYDDALPNQKLLPKDKTNFIASEVEKVIDGPLANQKNQYIFNVPEGTIEICQLGPRQIMMDTSRPSTIKLPASVKIINVNAFARIPYIGKITLDKKNQDFVIENNCLYTADRKILYRCFDINSKGTFTINEETEYIGPNAFSGCLFDKVVFNNRLKGIGVRAFSGCVNLSNAILPKNLEYIDNEAFADCVALKVFYIPNSKHIGNGVLLRCGNISQLIFDNSIREINYYLLDDVRNLKIIKFPERLLSINCAFLSTHHIPSRYGSVQGIDITLPDTVCNLKIERSISLIDRVKFVNNDTFYDIDGVVFKKKDHTLIYYPASRPGDVYNIPEECQKIFPTAFINAVNLRAIYVPRTKSFTNVVYIKNTLMLPQSIKTFAYSFKENETLLNVLLEVDVRFKYPNQTLSRAQTFLKEEGFFGVDIKDDIISAKFIHKTHESGQKQRPAMITITKQGYKVTESCSCGVDKTPCKHVPALILYLQEKYGKGKLKKSSFKDLIMACPLESLMRKGKPETTMMKARQIVSKPSPFSSIKVTSNKATAKIMGSDGFAYTVSIGVDNNTLTYSCTCPFDSAKHGACKHIGAFILYLQQHEDLFTDNI